VGDREAELRLGLDQRLLCALVLDPDAEDLTLGSFDAKRRQRGEIALVERPLPDERLVPDPPGRQLRVAVLRQLAGLGQREGQAPDVIPG